MDRQLPGLASLQANNIFCIGRNFALHAREMKSDIPDKPLVFLKPNSALLFEGGTVLIPFQSVNVHYEVELVVAIGKTGKNIKKEKALDFIDGIAVGIDFTARDIQGEAKKQGTPWTVAKGFDTFAPMSRFLPYSEFRKSGGDLNELSLELFLNDERKQHGLLADLIFPIDALLSYLSTIFTLQPGDLIFTGTPEGVGPVHNGDRLKAVLNQGLLTLHTNVKNEL